MLMSSLFPFRRLPLLSGTLALCILVLLTTGPAQAQRLGPGTAPTQRTQVGFDLSLAPTANWSNNVRARLLEAQQDPTGADPDSLINLFNNEELPMRIGFKAGLALTISRGWLGIRAGANFLNTGGVFDGTSYLNENRLRENFLTFPIDLQLRKVTRRAVFYAFGGPEFRYRVDLRDEEDITFSTFRENMEPLSTLLTAGVGIRLHLMGMQVAPEMRYAHDLSGVSGRTFEAEGNTFELDDKYRLNNFVFGLTFGL